MIGIGPYILLFAAHAVAGIWSIWHWTKPATYGSAVLVIILGALLGFFALFITGAVKVIDSRWWARPLPSAIKSEKNYNDGFPHE
jgi:hypothetical protein